MNQPHGSKKFSILIANLKRVCWATPLSPATPFKLWLNSASNASEVQSELEGRGGRQGRGLAYPVEVSYYKGEKIDTANIIKFLARNVMNFFSICNSKPRRGMLSHAPFYRHALQAPIGLLQHWKLNQDWDLITGYF